MDKLVPSGFATAFGGYVAWAFVVSVFCLVQKPDAQLRWSDVLHFVAGTLVFVICSAAHC